MSTQSPLEKRVLKAAWDSDERVVALNAAVKAHVAESAVPFGADAVTAAIQFASAWVRANGPLPESGLISD